MPLDPVIKLSVEDCPAEVNDTDRKLFMEINCSLLYAAVFTRPNIAKAMTMLGRFMANPGPAHVIAIKRVLRYVVSTLDRGLKYTNKPWHVKALSTEIPVHEIVNFTYSDWAGDLNTRNSTSATCEFIACRPLSWLAKLQHIKAQSSWEAEYIAMGDGAKDTMYVRNALRKLDFYPTFGPTKMLVNSSAALGIASRPGINNKTKLSVLCSTW
uniref:Reverse transcriptase Ty1/copia-type domain-containing protein n=1 Tax=Hemiselmis andersenii TaxID=464988 RepID=A0A7S0U4E2_HEMAN|mmetsp:Transcript_32570/g.75906  ORF Transcript_32570/g.75906 Transcript_32570/m.75906 type:complete len:212 (+) Transcript_32570:391-1026(+)